MKRKIIAISLAMTLLTGSASMSFAAADASSAGASVSAAETGTVAAAALSSSAAAEAYADASSIVLSDSGITFNGSAVGTDGSAAVYTSNDIIYYEDRDTYDSGNTYGEGTASDRHTAAEADAHTVVNITEPGTYIISGTLSKGQIAVDLGEDAKADPDAKVTLILNGADVTCTVAPALIFYNVYECNTQWVAYDNGETEEYNASADVDTSDAGASVIIADGSVNTISGSHVAKIYKDNADQKKKHKYDGAFYSCMSMNIDGGDADTGILNIIADNEGLDSEMHLTFNGGRVFIQSQDDGINTNEDGVSVTTINDGELHIVAGLGSEGDGVDSNGYLVINGGTVIATAKPQSDSGLDSDMGSYINGGYVVATGSTMDWAESDSQQVTMNLQFASSQDADEAIIVTDTDGTVIFAYDPDKDETTGSHNRGYQGAVISCPEFEVGKTYNVYIGGDVTGTEVNGLYDASTVTGFSGAVRQEYTGTDVGRGGPGGFRGERPELPEGADPEEFAGQKHQRPDDADRDNMQPPELPEGMTMEDLMNMRPDDREGFSGPGGSGQDSSTAAGPASVNFYMNDKVNAFSGVTDEGTSIASGDENTGNDTEGALGFKDISKTGWYYSGVEYAVNHNLFNGTSSTTFEPDANMTRAMLWTVLARIDGKNPDTSAGTKWYSEGQRWAEENEISDGTMPDSSITREQLVTMLYRYADGGSAATESGSASALNDFSDASQVSEYAREAMAWAVEKGIITGMSASQLSPGSTATRAQVAAIIQRYASL
ncbi:MAG: S-layer homology domain-containing protein [Anaerovoracaceae bacterium]